ncbi:MAG: pseudouridine synthase, partial [Actinomycetes bacterium]
MDGLVVVDKPSGWTSHDVVARMRRIFGQKRVGHAGTLDPDATGILLVGLGRATRLLKYVQETGKVYEGVVAFGIATDTLDAAGVELQREPMSFERADLESAKSRFIGDIEQIPPMVS